MYQFAVIGLGYVGLRTALALSGHKQFVIGYDVNKERLSELARHYDCNLDRSEDQLEGHTIQLTDDASRLKDANFYIVDIGTPVNEFYVPDMSVLKIVCKTLGTVLKPKDVIVFESTVYPGATEEIFIPILEQVSQLKSGVDFYVGYSPERIVPGDEAHDIVNTPKIIAGQDSVALKIIEEAYALFVDSKLVSVSCIKAAEAAKVLENIQRDVNIALMNEYTTVMDRLNVSMSEVLMAAGTKWNFLPFRPGLVGGHCISVDPYYLIYKARGLHVDTDLINSARKVNENFTQFISNKLVSTLMTQYPKVSNLNVTILGLSYKKNVSDTRNSLSFHLVSQLTEKGFNVTCCDPLALVKEHSIDFQRLDWDSLPKQQAFVIAVDHDEFKEIGIDGICKKLLPHGMILDIPGLFYQSRLPRNDIIYWSV